MTTTLQSLPHKTTKRHLGLSLSFLAVLTLTLIGLLALTAMLGFAIGKRTAQLQSEGECQRRLQALAIEKMPAPMTIPPPAVVYPEYSFYQALTQKLPRPKPLSTPPSTPPSIGYSLQLGSFRSLAEATAKVDSLRRHEYKPFISKSLINHDVYYRVRMGHFRDIQAARAANVLLSTQHLQALVVRDDG